MPRKQREKVIKLCPRCGMPYSYLEIRRRGDKIYYYAVHEEWKGGRRISRRKCYLGPDIYTYVTALHTDERLVLYGMLNKERALAYLERLLNFLKYVDDISILDRAIKLLENHLSELKRLVEVLQHERREKEELGSV